MTDTPVDDVIIGGCDDSQGEEGQVRRGGPTAEREDQQRTEIAGGVSRLVLSSFFHAFFLLSPLSCLLKDATSSNHDARWRTTRAIVVCSGNDAGRRSGVTFIGVILEQ